MEEPERTGSIGEVMGALGTGRKTARCAHGKGTGRPRPPPDHDIVHQRAGICITSVDGACNKGLRLWGDCHSGKKVVFGFLVFKYGYKIDKKYY